MANVSQSKNKSSKKDVNIIANFHDRNRLLDTAAGAPRQRRAKARCPE